MNFIIGLLAMFVAYWLKTAVIERIENLELRIIELKQELQIADIHRFTGLPSPAELEILRMKTQAKAREVTDEE